MNKIKTVFSIKDLENLSGIKAHTIRIWEKRYGILQPVRTETNVRLYDIENLQKLLNIALLLEHGYKISKISDLPSDKIPELVKEIVTQKSIKNHAVGAFKIAMMNFDQDLFLNTYEWLLEEKSFTEIFCDVFIPLLDELGVLWQIKTITPAHEHFMSQLIKRKLISNIDSLQQVNKTVKDKVFVFSLPMNEIHELGLLFVQYEVLLRGYRTVYLGESVPLENLVELKRHFDSIVFVTYLTVQPDIDSVTNYVQDMSVLLSGENNQIWCLGKLIQYINRASIGSNVKIFDRITDLIREI